MTIKWHVYILKSLEGIYYTGISQSPNTRFKNHVKGNGGKYTKSITPFELVYSEQHEDIISARKRESQIKRWNRNKKTALVTGDLEKLKQLSKSRQHYSGRSAAG